MCSSAHINRQGSNNKAGLEQSPSRSLRGPPLLSPRGLYQRIGISQSLSKYGSSPLRKTADLLNSSGCDRWLLSQRTDMPSAERTAIARALLEFFPCTSEPPVQGEGLLAVESVSVALQSACAHIRPQGSRKRYEAYWEHFDHSVNSRNHSRAYKGQRFEKRRPRPLRELQLLKRSTNHLCLFQSLLFKSKRRDLLKEFQILDHASNRSSARRSVRLEKWRCRLPRWLHAFDYSSIITRCLSKAAS